jgi:DNA-binding NarL/FixJ family response regulator
MPNRNLKANESLKIVTPDRAEFRAAVVARDAMSSGLLVDVLVRNLKCSAMSARSSELMELLANGRIELVIISADIRNTHGSGFELANLVSNAYPTVPIVILIDEPTREATLDALRSGASGVFNRQMPLEQFCECILHVRKGSIWAGADETRFLLEAFKTMPALASPAELKNLALSARELQVVQCAASGKTNKAIAGELFLSEHTVKNYLFRAFEKLGVSSRVELLFYLTMQGHVIGSSSRHKIENSAVG